MAATPNIVDIIGNLTADPEIRTLSSGVEVANFSIASTPRRFDREANGWVDGETVFYNVSAWRQDAKNLVASARKGDRLIIKAEAKPNTYETKEGSKVTGIQFNALEIGVSLSFATAKVTRNNSGGQSQQSAPTAAPAQEQQPVAAAAPAAAAPAYDGGDDDFS